MQSILFNNGLPTSGTKKRKNTQPKHCNWLNGNGNGNENVRWIISMDEVFFSVVYFLLLLGWRWMNEWRHMIECWHAVVDKTFQPDNRDAQLTTWSTEINHLSFFCTATMCFIESLALFQAKSSIARPTITSFTMNELSSDIQFIKDEAKTASFSKNRISVDTFIQLEI